MNFLFYQPTALSSHAVDGHQMYFGDSVVGKASTIGIGISYTPPVIFTGGQKVRNLASFKTSLNFEPLAFQNAARSLKSETNFLCRRNDRPSPSLVKWIHALLRTVGQKCPTPKIAIKHAKSSINNSIVDYSIPWNFVEFKHTTVQVP